MWRVALTWSGGERGGADALRGVGRVGNVDGAREMTGNRDIVKVHWAGGQSLPIAGVHLPVTS